MMQVPNKQRGQGQYGSKYRPKVITYLSLQYNKLLLGVVIWFSHMALESSQLLCPKTGVRNTDNGNRHVKP